MRCSLLCMAIAALASGCRATGPLTVSDLRGGDALRATPAAAVHDAGTVELLRQVNGSLEVRLAAGGAPIRWQLAELSRLEVARGRDRGRGALAGAAAGVLGGVVAGMLCRTVCADSDSPDRLLAPVVGLAIGGAGGALIGMSLAPTRWHEVRLR